MSNLWIICVFITVTFLNKYASCEKENNKEVEGRQIHEPSEELISAILYSSPLCLHKCPNSVNDTRTFEYCETSDKFKMQGRCCVNTTQDVSSSFIIQVLGIDLHGCSLTHKEFADGIQNFSSLVIISIEGNPIENVTASDFHENVGIKYLSLPINVSCPGGKDAWGFIGSDDSATICQDELNSCIYKNITCPENSHCEPAGIEVTQCLCNTGYHGYKCLYQGTFPIMPYVVGLVVPTVILSVFLWCTQRRYVKPKTT